jgi:preprotein translocase subunit SecE
LESRLKQGWTRKEPMAKAVTMTREDQGNRMIHFPARMKSFLTDVRNEMRKVTFPSRKEVQATTTVVIITVILFGVYFFVIDQVIATGINWVLHHRVR